MILGPKSGSKIRQIDLFLPFLGKSGRRISALILGPKSDQIWSKIIDFGLILEVDLEVLAEIGQTGQKRKLDRI